MPPASPPSSIDRTPAAWKAPAEVDDQLGLGVALLFLEARDRAVAQPRAAGRLVQRPLQRRARHPRLRRQNE